MNPCPRGSRAKRAARCSRHTGGCSGASRTRKLRAPGRSTLPLRREAPRHIGGKERINNDDDDDDDVHSKCDKCIKFQWVDDLHNAITPSSSRPVPALKFSGPFLALYLQLN